jgi:hypothetical protein
MNASLKEAIAALNAGEAKKVLELEAATSWTYGDVVELFRQAVDATFSTKKRGLYPRQAEQHGHILEIRRYSRERVRTMPVDSDGMIHALCLMAGKQWRRGKEAEVFLERADQVLGNNFNLWCKVMTELLEDWSDLRAIRLIVDHVARRVVSTARSAKDLERASKLVAKMSEVRKLLLDKAIAYAAELEKRPASSIYLTHPLS